MHITQSEFKKISNVKDELERYFKDWTIDVKTKDGGWQFILTEDNKEPYYIWHSPKFIKELSATAIVKSIIDEVLYSYSD